MWSGTVVTSCTDFLDNGYWSHAGAHVQTLTLLESDLLEQAFSRKLHATLRDVQIETDQVTFFWSLGGHQDSQWERKASSYYVWFVSQRTQNQTWPLHDLWGNPNPPALRDQFSFLFLSISCSKGYHNLALLMLNKICKCLSFVFFFLSKQSTATQNFNTQVTIHSHSKQQNVKHREQQCTLAFDHLGHNRALVHYLYT